MTMLKDEVKSLREQVRALTTERDEMVEEVESAREDFRAMRHERDTLRARVAELERLAYIGDHHSHALTWKARFDEERARVAELEAKLATARDAALEEAVPHAADAAGAWCSGHGTELTCPIMRDVENAIRALKAQPARRFVDADRVRDVLDLAEQGLRMARDYGIDVEHHYGAVFNMLSEVNP